MIDRWNSAVKPEDEVWHLGDFAVRQSVDRVSYLLGVLHGRKHLIVGNNEMPGSKAAPFGTASSSMRK